MSQNMLKCYGIFLDTSEVMNKISTGVMDDLLKSQQLVGVYQDSNGQREVLIYGKKEMAKKAVSIAESLGFKSMQICPTMIYVAESDVKNKDAIVGVERTDVCE